MFAAEFNVVCKLKVHESGYEIADGKVKPIHKNSNTREENFSRKTYMDFMDLNNHRSDKIAFEDRIIIFHNKWGMLSNDIYIQEILASLTMYSMMNKDIQKTKLPPSKLNLLQPTTRLTYQFRDGKVLPTFQVKTLPEAIELTFFLTSELKQLEYKTCKHFEHYGFTDGCMKRFPYRPNKDNCSSRCKDLFNKKKSREKAKRKNIERK